MGSSGDSGGGDQVTTIRYADYIESKHKTALDLSAAIRKSIIDSSPYTDYEILSGYDAFFSLGITLSTYPAMYDNFGKYLSGIDVDALFSDAFVDKMANTDAAIETELSILNDSIDQMQKENISARDMNATNGSAFIVTQANIERNKIAKTTEFRIAIKYSLIPGIVSSWSKTLSWDKTLVTKYAESLRDYYLCRINADDFGYKMKSNDVLWPFTVLDFERTMLSAMTGTKAPRTMTEKERSDVSKALVVASYTLQGVQFGSMVPGLGTLAGGVVGFVIGTAMILME